MSGRLSLDPEAAVSARYYGAVTTEHLDRLARLAAARADFALATQTPSPSEQPA